MNHRLFTLYINYLTGRCSREEFLEMKKLLLSVTDNELGNMMEESWASGLELPVMKQDAKERIKADILMRTRFDVGFKKRRNYHWAAAITFVCILAGSLLYFSNQHTDIYQHPLVVHIERGQKATMKLPDNSQVHLNAGTTLQYDLSDKHNRKLMLDGEAYFEVERDEKRPFIVDMNEVQIWVLGTSFNVKTYDSDDYVQASLVEGSVKFRSKTVGEWHYLNPMEQFIYSKQDGSFRIESFDSTVELAWMNDKLVFNSEPLYRIIQQIERWYGVEIDLQYPEIRNDRMTGTFQDEDIRNVMETIRIQYKADYTMNGKKIIISKNIK